MDRVDSLAECLVELRNQLTMVLTNQQNLLDYDKQRVVFAARHQSRLDTWRFRSPKKKQEFTPGVESWKRHALTTTAPLAQWPDCCRLIEAIFVRLCVIHRSPRKRGTGTVSRWDLILEDYRKIRRRILSNGTVMQQTTLQLVDVSHTTRCSGTIRGLKGKTMQWCCRGWSCLAACLWHLTLFPLPMFVPNQQPPSQVLLTITSSQMVVRQLFPAPPQLPSGPQMVLQRQLFPAPTLGHCSWIFNPVTSQVQVQVAAPQAPNASLSSVLPAPTPAPTTRKLTRKVVHNTCKKCGKFRTAETGHSQYKGVVYCPLVEALPKEPGLKDMRNKNAGDRILVADDSNDDWWK
ncbi:hypothetical protein KUCAC02_004125, partial [Chaenocephalus aceratus]